MTKHFGGDGFRLHFTHKRRSPTFRFFETKDFTFLLFLHTYLRKFGYISPKKPKLFKTIRFNDEVFYSMKFSTWTFSSFIFLYEEWYAYKLGLSQKTFFLIRKFLEA